MPLRVREEVREALAERRAVVALETSVVAQGLPPGPNLEAARACEAAARSAGAVPATVAVIDGEIVVGLEPAELERLAEKNPAHLKIGSRDLAVAVCERKTGGTTVSATCEIAARAGIRFFATGGIGGVHRGLAERLDVSQDLWALSRFPVAVVCAGAKSVLDLEATLELLESLAVPVIGIGTGELPSFYSARSGLQLDHSVPGAVEAARVCQTRFALGQGGLVLALPPPSESALGFREVEAWLATALDEARRASVVGKAVTPFLLARLGEKSGGRTLRANVALLEHNARFAAEVAVASATMDGDVAEVPARGEAPRP